MDKNPAIVSLFDKYGYVVRRNSPYAYHKIIQLKALTDK